MGGGSLQKGRRRRFGGGPAPVRTGNYYGSTERRPLCIQYSRHLAVRGESIISSDGAGDGSKSSVFNAAIARNRVFAYGRPLFIMGNYPTSGVLVHNKCLVSI